MKYLSIVAALTLSTLNAFGTEFTNGIMPIVTPIINNHSSLSADTPAGTIVYDGNAGSLGFWGLTPSLDWVQLNQNTVRSEVWYRTASGYGNLPTKIRTWTTNALTTGTAITYVSDVVNGDYFLINQEGLYTISYQDQFSVTANAWLGITKNETTGEYNQPLYSFTSNNVLAGVTSGSSVGSSTPAQVNVTTHLVNGDKIRAHTDGGTAGANPTFTMIRITQIGN